MKKILFPIIFILSIASVNAQKATIASYNIRNGVGIDNKKDLNRTASIINALNAEIIAVQEIDSVTARSKNVDVLKHLASLTDMKHTFARAIKFDGGAYGVGVLSKVEPLKTVRIPLPGKEERRVLLICEFEDYVVFATHFSLTELDALNSVKIIIEEAKRYKKPVILAGDLNIKPDSKVYAFLKESFSPLTDDKIATYPSDNPRVCIDYIMGFKNHDFKLKRTLVFDSAKVESDHLPLLVQISKAKKL